MRSLGHGLRRPVGLQADGFLGWALAGEPRDLAALAPPGHGAALLAEHRPAIELLRLSLHDLHSPYAHVLDALAAELPALSVTERAEVARLAREGPPEEAVGLEPYGPPEAMPTGARA